MHSGALLTSLVFAPLRLLVRRLRARAASRAPQMSDPAEFDSVDGGGSGARGDGGRERQTLFQRKATAKSRGDSQFAAAVAHASKDMYYDAHAVDAWQLPLVLGTTLAYLYTRRIETTILIFVGYYFFEYAVYLLASRAFSGTVASLSRTHTRAVSLLLDPLRAALALLVALFVIEHTAFGTTGAGGDPAAAEAASLTWRTALVLLATLATGFVRLYWVALTALLGTVWFLYALESARPPPVADYALWLAGRASVFVLAYGAAFARPIAYSFGNNTWFALALVTWFAAALQFIIEQQ